MALLTPPERRILERLNTPRKIQDYLDTLSINFEPKGETYTTVRRTLKTKTAHCVEGALVAAAALAYHGHKPLLMDFQTLPEDEDHVIALFKQNGYWGAISKTNHSVLRYREPVYKSPRELAMSHFHEYLTWSGKKSLKAFSEPFDLSKYPIERWLTSDEDTWWLLDDLDECRHFPAVPKKNRRTLRRADKVELKAMKVVEWPYSAKASKGKKKSRYGK